MAQGKMKTKVKVPGKTKQKHNHKAKKQILKKGRIIIAPKKLKHLEAANIKKGLSRTINVSIEQEACQRAQLHEPKSFNIISVPGSSTSSEEHASKKK